jgi:thiamine pyridinylase
LYPYIPNIDSFFSKIKFDYEKTHSDVQLNLIHDTNSTYYNRTGGVLDAVADVYEIDFVLLKDFISKGKIQPLTLKLRKDLMPAGKVVLPDNNLYAVPHWLCSNFLYMQYKDAELEKIDNFSDLEKLIGRQNSPQTSLLTDLAGKLTLGELYSVCLNDEYRDPNNVIEHDDVNHIDALAESEMIRLKNITYIPWTRDPGYHSLGTFYQQQFALKKCRAYIGYAEHLYDMLNENKDSCKAANGCLVEKDIDIKPWVLGNKSFNKTNQPQMGWVDGLAIDASLNGQKKQDALEFVEFITSDIAYYDALIPSPQEAPRYLMPAYKNYFTDKNILKAAPLYSKLLPLALNIQTITAIGFGYNLRDVGAKFNTQILAQ